MKKYIETKNILAFAATVVLLTVVAFGVPPAETSYESPENRTVTVFAAAGTTTVIQQIASLYEQQTGCKVVTNFGSSSALAKQIAAGAKFDIYLSANSRWMDFVQEKHLIDSDSRQDLLGDSLVLISPSKSSIHRRNRSIEEILLSTSGFIAVADPSHVPAGEYAGEALQAMGCWESVRNRLIPCHSVRAAQQNVETDQCQLGIVYRAGAEQSPKVRILGRFDPSLHTPIRFSIAVSSNSTHGLELLEFMRLSAAERIFARAGYSILPGQTTSRSNDAIPSSVLLSACSANEWRALWISVKVAAACIAVVAVPGIMLGYLLAVKSFPGRSIVNACVHLPLVVPPVVTGYLALILLGSNSLVGGFLERTLGISFAFNWLGAVAVASVMGFPLLVRSVKTAVEMVDSRYRLAANTLGAGPARTFFTITLPLAGPGILAGLILAFARSLGEFGATAVFVGNIPGKTQTLSLAIYNFMQIPGAESSAMRLVVISVGISFAAMLGSEILLKRMNAFSGVRA